MAFSTYFRALAAMGGMLLVVACSQASDPSQESPAKDAVHATANHQGIAITEAWARPTLSSGQPGGVYLQITNHTDTPDRLLAVSSTRAGRTMMHDNVHEGDVVRMVMVKDVDIPAGETVLFAPGGKHIMLFGLDTPFQAGEQVPLVLTFETAGDIAVSAIVSADIAAPAGGQMHGH